MIKIQDEPGHCIQCESLDMAIEVVGLRMFMEDGRFGCVVKPDLPLVGLRETALFLASVLSNTAPWAEWKAMGGYVEGWHAPTEAEQPHFFAVSHGENLLADIHGEDCGRAEATLRPMEAWEQFAAWEEVVATETEQALVAHLSQKWGEDAVIYRAEASVLLASRLKVHVGDLLAPQSGITP